MPQKLPQKLRERNKELKNLTNESVMMTLLMLMKVKDYDKITISDICEKAGVSRNTFYRHFKTKENVFYQIVLNFNKETILNGIGNPFLQDDGYNWYIKYFNTVLKNLDFFKLIINSNLQYVYLNHVNDLLSANELIDQSTKYKRLMWNGAIQNITIRWINDGCKEPVEEIASICYEKFKFRN